MEGLRSQREWARGQWVRRWPAEGPPALPLPTCELCRFPPEHSGPNSFFLLKGAHDPPHLPGLLRGSEKASGGGQTSWESSGRTGQSEGLG